MLQSSAGWGKTSQIGSRAPGWGSGGGAGQIGIRSAVQGKSMGQIRSSGGWVASTGKWGARQLGSRGPR